MKYNAKYDRWVSKDGLIYRYDKRLDKLVMCSTHDSFGYERLSLPSGQILVHRLVWETFNGEIPSGFEIDHIYNNRKDNKLSHLQLVSRSENNRLKYSRGYIPNERTRTKLRNAGHTNWLAGKQCGFFEIKEFGKRFIDCYGPSDIPLYKRPEYHREHMYWRKHGYLKGELDAK